MILVNVYGFSSGVIDKRNQLHRLTML